MVTSVWPGENRGGRKQSKTPAVVGDVVDEFVAYRLFRADSSRQETRDDGALRTVAATLLGADGDGRMVVNCGGGAR
jgi:hypothetical protein